MRAQSPTKPAPKNSPEPLTDEDRQIIESLDLLEALELLETWNPDQPKPLPELEEPNTP